MLNVVWPHASGQHAAPPSLSLSQSFPAADPWWSVYEPTLGETGFAALMDLPFQLRSVGQQEPGLHPFLHLLLPLSSFPRSSLNLRKKYPISRRYTPPEVHRKAHTRNADRHSIIYLMG